LTDVQVQQGVPVVVEHRSVANQIRPAVVDARGLGDTQRNSRTGEDDAGELPAAEDLRHPGVSAGERRYLIDGVHRDPVASFL